MTSKVKVTISVLSAYTSIIPMLVIMLHFAIYFEDTHTLKHKKNRFKDIFTPLPTKAEPTKYVTLTVA